MRFGQQLQTSLRKDWYSHYISYDDLKNDLDPPNPSQQAQKQQQKAWSEDDEQRFVNKLEHELDNVCRFQESKSQDIIRRIKDSEKSVQQLIAREEKAQHEDGPSADQPSEDEYLILDDDLLDIIADVHDLAKFSQLNYTGFQKILKKHDKQTRWHLKPVFAARLNARPFYQNDYDETVIKLSRLYNLVRTRGHPILGDASAGGKQQNFVRETTKYWVHPDNITELKLIIMQHLPVMVFNPNKEFDKKDSAITSIYYDNTDTWELYEGRLKKSEGAEAIRLRWYGGMDSDTIFVERKTHREDWTGEKSVKARFTLKEKNVNAFLEGRLTTKKAFEKMRADGKKGKEEIDNLEQLAKEIQFRVIDRKLVPVCRSFYNRTAFQIPGDARVRVSLDTELTLVREDNLDGGLRSGDNWRRKDIGIDFPFSQLPPKDIDRFPYGVLEVKLQTAAGAEPPDWITQLTSSHLVEAVPKFSKFIHGCAVLFPTRINLLPFWWPQMDTDIRKPETVKFGIEKPAHSTDASFSAGLDDDSDDELENESRLLDDEDAEVDEGAEATNGKHDTRLDKRYTSPLDGDPNILDEEELVAHKEIRTYDEDIPYESDDEEDRLAEAKQIGGWTYGWQLVKRHASMAGDELLYFLKQARPMPRPTQIPVREGRFGLPDADKVQHKRFRAPKGKKIHVPVRIEPKVIFAAERTFLQWLESAIILGTIAATLLNFGDDVSLASAWAFTVLAVIALLYSMGLFLWRTNMIRNKRAVNYHDKWGPSVLCLGFVATIAISFGFRWSYGGEGNLKDPLL